MTRKISEQYEEIRTKLQGSTRPIFLFDDDPDGLASFLILYRFIKTGKGIPLRGKALNAEYSEKINNYQPDLIIILDKAVVEQEFFDEVKAPCIWIDHHKPQKRQKVTYLNPRTYNDKDNSPTSLHTYNITKEDLWIAMTGIISDWQLPPKEMIKEYAEKYPGYLPTTIKKPEEALFNTTTGELARIFSFNLKGKTTDVMSSIKMISRIKHPDELIEKQHSQARLIMKRYEKNLQKYEEIKKQIKDEKEDPILLFKYNTTQNAFSADLSNEMLYEHPEKIIIIAREKQTTITCSLRSTKINIEKILKKTLTKTGGEGGGHANACGAVIPKEQFELFIKEIREEIRKTEKKK